MQAQRSLREPCRPPPCHGREQHPCPRGECDGDADLRRARGRAWPPHRERKRRRERGQGRERQRADVGQGVVAGDRPAVEPRQQHDRGDAGATQRDHVAAQVARSFTRPRATQQARCEPVIADHQAQGERADDDHARAGTQSTQECEQGKAFLSLRERQREYVEIRRHVWIEQRRARAREREHRQRDQQQVQRKQPARGAHVVDVAAFDDGHVELVRQDEHRQRPQQHERREAGGACGRRQLRHGRGCDAVEPEPDEGAEGQHRSELEQRLERHRQHQPAVVLDRAGPTRAEEHGERRHRQRDIQRAIAPHRRIGKIRRASGEDREAHGHGLELQCDVRDEPERRDQGHRCGKPCVLAQARGDEVGDRGRVGLARKGHQPRHHREREQVQRDRTDEGRWQRPAVARRLRDRAVERPRRAMHRQRQRIDMAPVPCERMCAALGIQRGAEHQRQPEAAGDGDVCRRQHGDATGLPPAWNRNALHTRSQTGCRITAMHASNDRRA